MTRPPVARVLLGTSMILAYVMTSVMVMPYDALHHPWGLARLVPMDGLLHPVAWAMLGLVYALAVLAWVGRWRPFAAGGIALALLGVQVCMEMSVRQIFMPHLENMLAGGLMVSWVVGYGVATVSASGDPEDVAHEMVVGAFGAMLTLAAGSKLWWSGLGWLDGPTHCAVIYEHSLAAQGPLAGFRAWASQQPVLCTVGAVYVLVVEALGVGMVVPRLRRPLAWAVVLVFAFLCLFQGIWEVSWGILALALSYGHLGGTQAIERSGTLDK